jgi:hypothetical protein
VKVVEQIVALIQDACNSGNRGTNECLNMVVAAVADFYSSICGSRTEVECATYLASGFGGLVLGYVDFVLHTVCGYEPPAQCADDEIALILGAYESAYNAVYNTLCPNGEFFQDCGQRYLTLITSLIDDVCNDEVYGTSGANECVNMAVALVGYHEKVVSEKVCYDEDWVTCASRVANNQIALIMSLIDNVCNDEEYGTSGASECLAMALAAINRAINDLCTDESYEEQGATECVNMAVALVGYYEEVVREKVCNDEQWATCASRVANQQIALITSLIDDVCNDDVYGTSGANECLAMVLAVIDKAVDDLCTDEGYGEEGAIECVNMAVALVRYYEEVARDEICYGDDWATCASRVADNQITYITNLVESTLTNLCDSPAPVTCVNNLIERVWLTLDEICGPSSSTTAVAATDPAGSCVGLVMGVVSTVTQTLCQSEANIQCVYNLLDKITLLVEKSCTPEPALSFTFTAAGDPSGACIELVMGVVSTVTHAVCQAEANIQCVNNLLNQIDDTLANACGLIPVSGESTTIGLPPGVATCVTKVLDTVVLVLNAVCDSAAPVTCAENLLDIVDDTLANACGLIPVSGESTTIGLPPGVATCVTKVLDTVVLVINGLCDSIDPVTCTNNLIDQIDDALGNACGLIPVSGESTTSGLPPGVATCVTKVLDTVALVLNGICDSTVPATCAENLIEIIGETVGGVCSSLPIADGDVDLTPGLPPGVGECIGKVAGAIELVLKTACGGSPEPVACAQHLIDEIDGLLGTACGTIPIGGNSETTGLPPGVSTCVIKVLDTVALVMNGVCDSTNAVTCATNLFDQIDDLLASTCRGLPIEDGNLDSTVELSEGVSACILKAVEVVDIVIGLACDTPGPEECVTRLISQIDQAVAGACRSIPVADGQIVTNIPLPQGAICIVKALGAVELALATACTATGGAACLGPILNTVYGTVFTVAGIVLGAAPVNPIECEVPVDSAGYTCQEEAFHWENAEAPTYLTLADDGVSSGIDLPFSFNWYGQSKSKVWISAEGHVCFSATCAGKNPAPPPASTSPNDLVACFWEDLDPSAGGFIYYEPRGEAPNRTFVVTYEDILHKGELDPNVTNTFQIVLRENGDAACELADVSGDGDMYSTSVGTEDSGGTRGLRYKKANSLSTNYVAIRFAAPATHCPIQLVANSPEADTLPPLLPPGCAGGARIRDHGVGLVVPPSGSGVYVGTMGPTGGQEFAIEVDPAGTVHLLMVGDEQQQDALEGESPLRSLTDDAYDRCRDSENELKAHESDQKAWGLNFASIPILGDLTYTGTEEAVRRAHTNISRKHNSCGLDEGPTRATWTYTGNTTRRADIDDGSKNDCSGWFDRDGNNTLDFGDLRYPTLGLTCSYYALVPGAEITEADIRLNSEDYDWTTRPNDRLGCFGEWDVEGIATHEVGHSYGLAHVDEHPGWDLVMSPYAGGPCSDGDRQLGLGDWLAMTESY